MCSKHPKTSFLESLKSGDDSKYLQFDKKIQINDFERILTKKYVKNHGRCKAAGKVLSSDSKCQQRFQMDIV